MAKETDSADPGRRGRTLPRRALALGAVLGLIVWSARRRPDAAAADKPPPVAAEDPGSGPVESEPRAAAERISQALPPGVTLDRLAVTPRHAVLRGRTEDLESVAELLENLTPMRGIDEPRLRRVCRVESGYELAVVVPFSRAARGTRRPARHSRARPPPYAAPALAGRLLRLLVPPFT